MGLETTIIGGYPKIGDSTEEQKLRRSLHQFDQGNLEEEELAQVYNEVTKLALQRQVDAGIDIITDGLIRWDDAVTYLARKIAGFEFRGLIRYFDTNTFYREPIVESRLGALKPLTVDDWRFAAEHTSKPVKAVLTGPFTLAQLSHNQFYREERQLLFDLSHILHREVEALEEAGCLYIQFDEPALLHRKQDLKLFFQAYEIVAAERSKVEKTILFHFGSIEGIYPKILELPVERIGIELTKGHRNWDVFKEGKWSKKLMAGVVDTRNTKMESESEIVELVQRLGDEITLDQVWLTHNHALEFLPRSNADKKMELLAHVAKQLKGASVS